MTKGVQKQFETKNSAMKHLNIILEKQQTNAAHSLLENTAYLYYQQKMAGKQTVPTSYCMHFVVSVKKLI
jgi:hypothetical protein